MLNNERLIEVSLVIPVYNTEEFILQTLESVKKQTLKNFECIIVNDFSTDNSLQIIKKTIKDDYRFKIINHKANAGLSASRNTGLRAAKGKYVAFLDADDLIMPNSLLYRKQTLDVNCDEWVIGTYCGSLAINEECKIAPRETTCKLIIKDFITSMGQCPFNANQPMFKTNLLRKFGGFNQNLTQAEDYDMWIRIMRSGYGFIPTQLNLVTYRMRKGSMVRNDPLLHLKNSMYLMEQCYLEDKNLPKNNGILTFRKGLSDYIMQREKIGRVLNFSGMAIAAGNSLDDIVKKMCNEIPDFFLIRRKNYEEAFYKGLLVGINRFFNSEKTLEELSDYLWQNCKEVYNNFYFFSQENNLNSTRDTTLYDYDIVFIPHKDYHTHTIKLMIPYLDSLNIKYIILDISMHYRDEKAISVAEKYDLPCMGYSNFVMQKIKAKSIIVFNDWEIVTKFIVMAAKKSGIKTIGIVEGINDYLDVDTKRTRNAYQTVEYLFLPGLHDEKYFSNSNQKLFIGGIPRIYDMFHRKKKQVKPIAAKKEKIALINSNFSYGVLVEHRDQWLQKAIDACLKSGYKPIITKHPADIGKMYQELVTSKSFYEILEECDVFISRFASGILEALARNKLPIYFNPHGENVDKFKEPMEAYPIANTQEQLQNILENIDLYYNKGSLYFESFIRYHCGDLEVDPSCNIAHIINSIINNDYECNYDYFFNFLNSIDEKTLSFENRKLLENILLNFNNNIDDTNKADIFSLCLAEFKKENYTQVEKYIKSLRNMKINDCVISRLELLKNDLESIDLNI
ncbi:glycosyltransferase family 2 protein [Campylobacter lari]|uniref:bifunctional glycosyltransferase/CDP-glycerol:glycerophosphate glycerophosphotransferase n=1 Tax=Campylobacter lari TaxID=201 RepID=UPI0012884B6E|nr:glycosyltransferase family A protein [Campylobacter lari]EAJ8706382.1 glycosyltransferase family 2 protein [Campylobacter jejuni]EAI7253434.1 glycosyltransferase family 2 protein [Campylobacter lari]EAK0442346.1 glycosyltransferase family 2 protein [Campylobacter lari]EAL0060404.1 glycosyltransferase family 2 protein [Campylobacter lari]ECL4969358.1 glycosyltransferase family 2 protein [Campylobacter lari]